MDLIIPHVGELIGGSQREENHEILLQRYARYDALPSWVYMTISLVKRTKHSDQNARHEDERR